MSVYGVWHNMNVSVYVRLRECCCVVVLLLTGRRHLELRN